MVLATSLVRMPIMKLVNGGFGAAAESTLLTHRARFNQTNALAMSFGTPLRRRTHPLPYQRDCPEDEEIDARYIQTNAVPMSLSAPIRRRRPLPYQRDCPEDEEMYAVSGGGGCVGELSSDLTVPRRYQRHRITQEEIDYINGGGIADPIAVSNNPAVAAAAVIRIPKGIMMQSGKRKQMVTLNIVLQKEKCDQ